MRGMNPLLWFAAAYLALALVGLLVILVQLLRLPLHPLRVRRLEQMPELPPDQAAALAEVRALGFEAAGAMQAETGAARYAYLLLRHPTLPCFATLTLLPAGGAGYPVTFYTFRADGKLLLTSNRLGWSVFATPPEVLREDPYAQTLDAHWQAHQARLPQTGVAAMTDDEAQARIAALGEGYFPLLQARGLCTQDGDTWHPSLKAALVATWRWRSVARKLAKRYTSAVTGGDTQAAYFTRCYLAGEAQQASRPARRRLKFAVLALSIVAALLLWGLMFKWATALMLVAIIFVHESGHALAMRAFGYRDMSMFFIPFVGAIVTGKPRELPSWQQALILFAGPLPGLLLGLAILFYGTLHPLPHGALDWRALAGLAVSINLFNLLPLTPLDGGQLMEVCLFNRWPLSRMLFAVLGACGIVALALWLKAPSMVFLAVVLALGLRTQFRVMRLQQAWQPGLGNEAQLRNLFEAARKSFKVQTYAAHAAAVKAVLTRRTVRAARLWESALILAVMAAVWSVGGVAVYRMWHPHPLAQRVAASPSFN